MLCIRWENRRKIRKYGKEPSRSKMLQFIKCNRNLCFVRRFSSLLRPIECERKRQVSKIWGGLSLRQLRVNMYNEWRCERNVLRQCSVIRLSFFAFLFLPRSLSFVRHFFLSVYLCVFGWVVACASALGLAKRTHFVSPRKMGKCRKIIIFCTAGRMRPKQDTVLLTREWKQRAVIYLFKVCCECECVFPSFLLSFIHSIWLVSSWQIELKVNRNRISIADGIICETSL